MLLRLIPMFLILRKENQSRMRIKLSSQFSSIGIRCAVCKMWTLLHCGESNSLAVINCKAAIEEINLREGNENGLKHGFSFWQSFSKSIATFVVLFIWNFGFQHFSIADVINFWEKSQTITYLKILIYHFHRITKKVLRVEEQNKQKI